MKKYKIKIGKKKDIEEGVFGDAASAVGGAISKGAEALGQMANKNIQNVLPGSGMLGGLTGGGNQQDIMKNLNLLSQRISEIEKQLASTPNTVPPVSSPSKSNIPVDPRKQIQGASPTQRIVPPVSSPSKSNIPVDSRKQTVSSIIQGSR